MELAGLETGCCLFVFGDRFLELELASRISTSEGDSTALVINKDWVWHSISLIYTPFTWLLSTQFDIF